MAGPFASMTLADLGADVIKIERPGYGDLTRGSAPFLQGESGYYLSLNRGKRSLTLDLGSAAGRELFLGLVKIADVVMENFVPGTMARFGLDYPVLSGVNPAIIYAAISGFGQTGPYAQRPALDVVVQGMGGIMSVTGEPGGAPVRPGASLGDVLGGLYAVIGLLSALQERQRSGRGQMVDISMLDCQVAVQENAFMRYFFTGEIPGPIGSRHPVFTPFQSFATRDGYIVVAMVGGTSNQWALFCSAIDRVDLIDDPRYETGWTRTQNYAELEPIISAALRRKTSAEWLEELGALGIPCGPVNTIPQVAADPQVLEREMFVTIPHQRLGEVKLVGSPIKLSRTPAGPRGTAPDLGQHSAQLLQELLGLSPARVEELRVAGVIEAPG